METINNIAGAASKAIWGEQKTDEPMSGKQGAGTTTEPYDMGNAETPAEKPQTDMEKTTPPEAKANTEVPTAPKEDSKPKVPHTDEEREKAMEAGEFPRDPNDHSGEPLKMHGGPTDGEVASEENDEPKPRTDRSASVAQEGGNPHGKKLGTGEEYVKSSGLQADGGDFDATNPGAGAEAVRLLEEKGVRGDKASEASGSSGSLSSGSDKDKVSKMAKLKEKLHIKKSAKAA